MRRLSRRNIAALLVGLLALVALPAAAPPPAGDVRLVPPAGQTAVRGGQDVGVEGTTDPGNGIDRTTLLALDASGTVLDSYDLGGLVRNNGGTIEGAFRLGCALIPGCESGDGDLRARVRGYQLELELATTTGSSIARTPVLEFDELRPRITGYFLVAPNRIEVRFSEDVTDPEGDNPSDWQIEREQNQVLRIEGEGDRRVLVTIPSFGPDATPHVAYLPNPSLSIRPNQVYKDEAGNTLTAAGRIARAADRIPPVPPTIDEIAGAATSRDGDDQAIAVLGSDPTPTVVLGTIEDGHTGQLFLDDGDGTLEDNLDTFVGEAVASGGTAVIDWPAGLALPDDEHRLFARTHDGAACDPDDTAGGSCPNESGRSKDALYDLDTTAPTLVDPALASTSAITVVFSEAVTGPTEPADWIVTAPGGGPGPAVTGVSGSGDARVLAADGVLPGSTLTYAPAGARFVDTHGNELQDATIDVIAAPVPVARLVDAAPVDELDGPPALPVPPYVENEASFRIELSDPVRIGETATFTLEVVGVDATVGTDLEDPGQFTVDIPEGETGTDVTVELRGDTLDEFDETFELRVVDTNDAVTVADGVAVGTISDDDPLVDLSVADVTVTEGAVADVTASLDVASGKDVVADWTLEPDTASPGKDYEVASGTLRIPAGQTSVTVPVTTLDDDLDEVDTETLRLLVTTATNATVADGEAVVSISDDDPVPSIRISDLTSFEGDETRTETVVLTLSEVSGRDVQVDWSTSDGTATAGSDYTAASGTVTIPAGASGATVDLEILGDTDVEEDESLTITLSDPSNATISDGTASIVLLNDDGDFPPITLDVTGGEVDEGAGGAFAQLFPAQVVYTLTLSEPARGPIRVDVRTTADGSATPDADFESTFDTVEFDTGETSVEFPVDVLDDNLDEFDETITLEVLDPVGADLPGGAASTLAGATILDDDDLPTVAFTDGTAAKVVNEGDSTTLTVELDTPSGRDVTVGYATRYDGTATDADAPVQSGTVLIPAGSRTASFDITTSQDDLDEADEDFQVDLEATSNVALAGDRPVTATITIADDEVVLPVLTFTGGEVSEDDSLLPPLVQAQLVYTATLSDPTSRDVTVDVRTAPGGTATPEDDFVAKAGQIVIPAGEQSGTFTVSVIDDSLDEFDETVIALATDPAGARFANGLDQANATGTITDDDPVVSVSLAGDVEVAEGDPATFTVELSRDSGKDVTVRYSTDDDQGSADAGPDYTSTSGELTIPAGETSATFVVPTWDDAEVEPDETVVVGIEVLTPESATLGTGQATLTILDDDVLVGGDPVLGLTGATVQEGDPPLVPLPSTTTLEFELSLSEPAASDVVVDWTTSAGTATADADYEETTDQVTIAAGEDSAVIEVTVLPDVVDEFDERLTVTITGVTGPAQLPSGGLARNGVITDDDPLAVVGFAADALDVTVGEGDTATFTVELRGATEKPVTVRYATSYDGLATTDDAPRQTGTVEFPVGTTSATFTVSTTQDDLPEGDEALSVVLSSPVNATLDEGSSTATLTIDDDEVTLPTLTVEGGTVDESDGVPPLLRPQLVWTFTLSEPTPVDVTATYRTTAGGSATPESDFVGRSGTVTIPANERSTTIAVDVIDDDLDEFIEEVPLVVSDVVNARLPGGVDSVTELGRITDDDPVVTVSLGDDVTVTEGDPATIEVLLDAVSGKDVRVSYATRDSGADAGDDYTATSGELTIPAGEQRATFTVPTIDDFVVEPDEDVAIDLTVETPDAAQLGRGTATLTISDDDLPVDPTDPPVVGLTGATVDEGDPVGPLPFTTPMTLEVRLSRPAEGDVALAWETRAGSATADSDFTAASGTVTVPDGQDRAEITVDVLPDLVDEFDEDLFVALTDVTAGSATIPGGELVRTGRILDDDPLAVLGFTDASIDVGVTEGGTVELTVELTGETAKDVTVDYAVSFDGLASRDDAPDQAGTLAFPAGTTTASFRITTLQDDLDEPSESFSVVLSSPVRATLDRDASVATVTIADDDLVVPVLSVRGGDVDEGEAGQLGGFGPTGFSAAAVPPLEEPLVFTLTLSEPAEVDVLVDWATTDIGTAVAGADYTAASGTVTIPAGETSATVEVDVLDDDLDEFDETVVVRFSNLRNARFADGASRLDASGRITDDDPLVTAALGDDVEVVEGEPATFDVTLSAPSGKDVRVRLSTSDGTARSGQDYRATTVERTIRAGETSTTFTVATLDDSIVESTEEATVSLTVTDADTAELGRNAATLSITDDDVDVVDPENPDAAVVSLSGDAVEEGDPFPVPLLPVPGSSLEFVVRLSAPADGDVTVAFETRAGTATAGEDYTSAAGQVTIPDGESEAVVAVAVTPDTLDEFDEDLLLVLTDVTGNAVLPGGQLQRTGRILDDDDAAQLRVSDATVLEGAVAEVDVTLDTASGKDITVEYGLVDGTATAGDDYVAASGTLTFPAGTTSRTVDVATLADTETGELIEQFELVLSAPTNAALDDPRGTISIVDVGLDGLPTVTAVFLEDVRTVEADGDRIALVPVRLSAESDSDVVVTWSTQRLTAVDGEDYRADGGQVVVPAGATSAQIAVTIIGDDVPEPDEDFLVLLTEAEGAVITGPTGRVTIEDDDVDGDGGPGGGGGDGAPDGDVGATDDEGDLAATGGGAGAGFAVIALGLLAARRRRRDDDE